MKAATWTESEARDPGTTKWWRTTRLKIGNSRPGVRVLTQFEGVRFVLEPDKRYALPSAFIQQLLRAGSIEPAIGNEPIGGSGRVRLFAHEGVDD